MCCFGPYKSLLEFLALASTSRGGAKNLCLKRRGRARLAERLEGMKNMRKNNARKRRERNNQAKRVQEGARWQGIEEKEKEREEE